MWMGFINREFVDRSGPLLRELGNKIRLTSGMTVQIGRRMPTKIPVANRGQLFHGGRVFQFAARFSRASFAPAVFSNP
jgi:hypothetical protein